jgi:hypothetical protein
MVAQLTEDLAMLERFERPHPGGAPDDHSFAGLALLVLKIAHLRRDLIFVI